VRHRPSDSFHVALQLLAMNEPKDQDASDTGLKRIKTSIDALTNEIKAQRAEQKGWRERDKWPRRTAIAAIAYTVLTLIIMLIYGWQSYLIRSNNVVSQRAFVSVTFRPGISIWGPSPKKLTSEGISNAITGGSLPAGVSFIVDITNGGNTGSKNLTFFLKCAPSSEDLQDPWPVLYQGKNNAPKTPQFIGPHTTAQSACVFPIDQIEAMIDGKQFGYVMIDITYNDRLTDDPHRTEASAKVGAIQKLPGIEPSGTAGIAVTAVLSTYGRHNCADEECPRD
jgi:hypothetical protein